MVKVAHAVMVLLLTGCTPSVWADQVLSAPGSDPSVPFADPMLAANGARGAGFGAGGTDVYSLTLDGLRPELVLGFTGEVVVDGEGADFVVYENGFDVGQSGERFMDPVVVAVSADGEDFVTFPHTYDGEDQYVPDPMLWNGFAGITPTARSEDQSSPGAHREPSGGDRFDLADLPPGAATDRILADGVIAIRLTPAGTTVNPATGLLFPVDPVSDGPDIDAIYAWSLAPE